MTREYTSLRACDEALTAGHFWCTVKSPFSGWVLIENLSIFSRCEVYFDNDAADYPQNTIKPLHSRPFQVDEGDQIKIGHVTNGEAVKIKWSNWKSNPDAYLIDEDSVENLPWHADGVNITTTYDFTAIAVYPTLRKQRISHVQVTGEAGAFVGTVEVSDDGGVTYSPPADLDFADPNKVIWELNGKWLTHVRVTRVAGAFAIEVW